MQTISSRFSVEPGFNVETFFQDRINEHCDLPNIDSEDAFALYYAIGDLITALATLKRLVPKLGSREIVRLIRAIGRGSGVIDLAVDVVRMVLMPYPFGWQRVEYARVAE